ncbi:MAG: RNA methyltransferase [Fluviicola sp.]|nr:RNA methyltransferase [Fluviicola sp.]
MYKDNNKEKVENLSKNKIKWIRSFQLKKNRDEADVFIVEGEKMIQELIEYYPQSIDFLCVTKESDHFSKNNSLVNAVATTEELKSISSMKNPNKSLAVVKKLSLPATDSPFKIVLDNIQDPGNMGTILRLADWFNVKEIICSHETVDIYNPKVVQASMGAIFRIPVTYCNLETYLSNYKGPIFGALLEGQNIYKQKLIPEGLLILGNEGNGISEKIKPFISDPITIPRFGKAESLNVSIATGILLSDFFRNS